ncbi:MAG: rhomboid family intramembrane serine protease [Halobacteriota archaeon]
MAGCEECGEIEGMPYSCGYCGGTYCSSHRLPENHDCEGLSARRQEIRSSGRIYEGPSADVSTSSPKGSKLPVDLGRFRNNVTMLLLILMVAVHALQFVVLLVFGADVHNALFTLRPSHVHYVWTWITSVFSHSPGVLFHILFNGIVLYFFGTVLERKIGSRRFLGLFVSAGIAAGLVQAVSTLGFAEYTGIDVETGVPILGASGAILAVLGALTVLRPNLKVYLWFLLPMPLWILTVAFAAYDVLFLGFGGPGAGGVARVAHLTGLVIGLAYGYRLKREGVSMRRQIELGGGGPPYRGPGRKPPGF